MAIDIGSSGTPGFLPSRRRVIQSTTALLAAAGLGSSPAAAQSAGAPRPSDQDQTQADGGLQNRMLGYMLAHERFPVPELVQLGGSAASAGSVRTAAIYKLFESGVTIVNGYSGRVDQQKVVEFHRNSELPRFASSLVTGSDNASPASTQGKGAYQEI
jgi:hypothetical protein